MEHTLAPYDRPFSLEERKRIVAQCLGELRRGKKLSQKEVAAAIGVSQATYSAYERGRNEPPIEILVRLSYLFGCSVDLLVQKDRLYRTAEDAQKQLEEMQREFQEDVAAMAANGGDNPQMAAFIDAMNKMFSVNKDLLNTVKATEALAETLDKK